MTAYARYPSLQDRAVLITGGATDAADDSAMCTAQDFIVDGGWA